MKLFICDSGDMFDEVTNAQVKCKALPHACFV